ncbi:hypothetical protein GCM10011584_09700 [Nocardioides phosphati]|uniref:Uncharacterized protein n=1 Tax=Nocardioides phosphati TaxID=1867775 RepID=A0ABQ2N7I1_9ACTN|nr:hypothetical protein [Nocardioides phosphati]GGO86712.1 hypothetical protein GCM10011584_09700 [Nocardioides phosphati]
MNTSEHTWRYLLARERLPTGENYFTVREVHSGPNHELSWTEDAIEPSGETWREIVNTLALMSGATNGPVLDLTLDPPALVRVRDLGDPAKGA